MAWEQTLKLGVLTGWLSPISCFVQRCDVWNCNSHLATIRQKKKKKKRTSRFNKLTKAENEKNRKILRPWLHCWADCQPQDSLTINVLEAKKIKKKRWEELPVTMYHKVKLLRDWLKGEQDSVFSLDGKKWGKSDSNKKQFSTALWLPRWGLGEGRTRSLGLVDARYYIYRMDKQQGPTV